VPLTQVSAEDEPGLIAKVRALGPDARVLIVGHSNTLPSILRALGHRKEHKIASGEYDNLFVVVPNSRPEPAVLQLRF
jgi:broad specificity phosphatase PhoE